VSDSVDCPEPLTDDQIAEATIGEPVRLDGRIELQESDPSWASLYSREETRIRRALGDNALVVEHVGSTAVPGLAAKPVIDVVLAVADSSDEESYVPALEAEGYVLTIREEGSFEHRLLKGSDTNVNLHVFSEGTAEIARMLAFRDHLTTTLDDRIRYEDVKRELASRNWKFVQNYADAKSQVIAEIMRRAINPRPSRQ
jgi:GrpB-like predicted nucleotidyltransferase (UPF0157 family)